MSTPKHQLVLYALHLAGGGRAHVSTEDVAIRAHQLFPRAFGWPGHAELPDKELTRHALNRARDRKAPPVVEGRAASGRSTGKDGWKLTPDGVRYIRRHETELRAQAEDERLADTGQRAPRRLERYRQSELFHRFQRAPAAFAAGDGELAELYRCRVDADERVWDRRFGELHALARSQTDEQLAAFVEACRAQIGRTKQAEGSA